MRFETKGKYDVHSYSKIGPIQVEPNGEGRYFSTIIKVVIMETIEQFVKNRIELFKELFRIPGVDEECTDGDDELITDEGEK